MEEPEPWNIPPGCLGLGDTSQESRSWAVVGVMGSGFLPGPDVFCDFNGKKYSPGESWHPYLEPQGLMYCIRCSCSESLMKSPSPASLEPPSDTGSCSEVSTQLLFCSPAPTAPMFSASGSGQPHAPKLLSIHATPGPGSHPVASPSFPEPHSPSGLRAPLKSCQYNGTSYQQGEMFTTSELFPSRQQNQCVQCSCSVSNHGRHWGGLGVCSCTPTGHKPH
uniref:Uncharacterized protein n=1 Tax=Melopsittacus undulatus TaxID=13146 RepID=A0A8V5HDC0_MELUD